MSKDFRRHSSHKLKRISQSWRKPRGLDNKVRLQFTGYVRKVKVGYGTAGSKPSIIVSNADELKACKGTNAPVLISSTVGQRKRLELVKLAEELSITLTNVAKDYVKNVEANLAKQKEIKQAKVKEKDAKQKELTKEAEKKEKEAEKEKLDSKVDSKDDKEKEAAEKKERDKLLTKKDSM